MSQILVDQSISQIFCQLKQLAHVQLEYSSTLFSYQTSTNILELFKENFLKQISNRQEEMKYFSTDQGIGLRKIMIQHYQRIYNIMSHEFNLISQATQEIYQKHKAMENSLIFVSFQQSQIDPIVKQIQHKSKVLDRELAQVKQKMEKLEQKRKFQTQSDINHQLMKQEKCKSQSEIFSTSENITQKQNIRTQNIENSNNASSISLFLSLFSPNKFDKLETETQFQQVQSFLSLKLQQVEQFIRIQKQLTDKTINKIFEIFDETMGKGLQRLQTLLLNNIQGNNFNDFQSTPQNSKQTEEKRKSSSSNSVDLSCYESLEDIMKDQIDLQRIRFVRKRLYESSQAEGGESIGDENGNNYDDMDASPTFKFSYPLVIDSVEQINQFSIQLPQQSTEIQPNKIPSNDNPNCYLYDSFCKENVNTINK